MWLLFMLSKGIGRVTDQSRDNEMECHGVLQLEESFIGFID